VFTHNTCVSLVLPACVHENFQHQNAMAGEDTKYKAELPLSAAKTIIYLLTILITICFGDVLTESLYGKV
jgi:hypothetical protein